MGGAISWSVNPPQYRYWSYEHLIREAYIREEFRNSMERIEKDPAARECRTLYERGLKNWLEKSKQGKLRELSLDVDMDWRKLRDFGNWLNARLDMARIGEAQYDLALWDEIGRTYRADQKSREQHCYFQSFNKEYWVAELHRKRAGADRIDQCHLEWQEKYLEIEFKREVERERHIIPLRKRADEDQIVAREGLLKNDYTFWDRPSDEQFREWCRVLWMNDWHGRQQHIKFLRPQSHPQEDRWTAAEERERQAWRSRTFGARQNAVFERAQREREMRKQKEAIGKEDEARKAEEEARKRKWGKEQAEDEERQRKRREDRERPARPEDVDSVRENVQRVLAFEQWMMQCNEVVGKGDKGLIRAMRVFPDPPAWPCKSGNCRDGAPIRSLRTCPCNIKELCALIGHQCTTAFLKEQRRRWHPDNFVGCPVYGARQKAEELFKAFGDVLDKM